MKGLGWTLLHSTTCWKAWDATWLTPGNKCCLRDGSQLPGGWAAGPRLLGRLTAESQPEVFLAEPVGSCTDLVATVTLPLERFYKAGFQMAPYAVLVDPYRAMPTLGVEGEPLFSPDVNYIYRKQLEEAEIIVVNKTDVIAPERLARLRAAGVEIAHFKMTLVEDAVARASSRKSGGTPGRMPRCYT